MIVTTEDHHGTFKLTEEENDTILHEVREIYFKG